MTGAARGPSPRPIRRVELWLALEVTIIPGLVELGPYHRSARPCRRQSSCTSVSVVIGRVSWYSADHLQRFFVHVV
jgi:hypothetical protein